MLKIKKNEGFEMETPILLNSFFYFDPKKIPLYKLLKKTKVSNASSWENIWEDH